MKLLFSDFSGGINTSETKLNLGLETKKIASQEALNVEIMSNGAIARSKGNVEFFKLEDFFDNLSDEQKSLNSIFSFKNFILLANDAGEIYSYNILDASMKLLIDTLTKNSSFCFTEYLEGVFIVNGKDYPLYFSYNDNEIEVLDLFGANGVRIIGSSVASFKSRLFIAQGATIFFSALGRYDDFQTSEDAGYINNFHVDSNDIVALKAYQEYLAIYKEKQTYLLSGNNISDFAVSPFANKGACAKNACLNINNKQYFFSNGLFALSQTGELNQIVMSSEYSLKIRSIVNEIDFKNKEKIFLLPYENKNQLWCFIPDFESGFLNHVLIFDYYNKAWTERKMSQNITCACSFQNQILSCDNLGCVFIEDMGSSFNGEPIEFCFKTPFFSLGQPNVRKTIEEFFLLLDQETDNNFIFSVFKDYNGFYEEDIENVKLTDLESLIFDDDNSHFAIEDDYNDIFHNCWAKAFQEDCKLEISESLLSVQICIRGNELEHNFLLLGIDFKEVLYD